MSTKHSKAAARFIGNRKQEAWHDGCPEVEDQHDDNDDTDQYFVG